MNETVREILIAHLKSIGADGLYNDSCGFDGCGCSFKEPNASFISCENHFSECKPATKQDCKPEDCEKCEAECDGYESYVEVCKPHLMIALEATNCRINYAGLVGEGISERGGEMKTRYDKFKYMTWPLSKKTTDVFVSITRNGGIVINAQHGNFSIELTRREARLLVKRINQALEATKGVKYNGESR